MDKPKKSWGLVLFGTVFFVAGLAAAIASAGKPLANYLSSTDWVVTTAKIHSLNLDTIHGDDSTTYRIEGQYSYR